MLEEIAGQGCVCVPVAEPADVHKTHCDQGEYAGTCKYGDSDCTARLQSNEPEWITWGPDSAGYPECPVAPGTDCEVKWSDGSTNFDDEPEDWYWGGHDIVAYRVWPKEPAADDALAYLEAEARRFAGFYPQGSDGRNTFVIFADKIAGVRRHLERNP